MRAYEIEDQALVLRERERPEPTVEQVRIHVRAFGVNRADTYMRRGLWGEVHAVSGIECVGEVDLDPSGSLARGTRVWALMGGMARTIQGSYAEYVCPPATNVVRVPDCDLSWTHLAAIPESYATAWSCLRQLGLASGQKLLVRGGTSALGRAAIRLASSYGWNVTATSRTARVQIEGAPAITEVREQYDAVLDLIGGTTLLDSLSRVPRGGRVCVAGFLGGHEPWTVDPVRALANGAQLSAFASFMLGGPAFPLHEVPFASFLSAPPPARVYPFAEIADAHAWMESNRAQGKIVVRL